MTLEQTLAPLWKLTYYGLFLFDWCRRISHKYWILVIFRGLFILARLAISIYFLVSYASKIVMAIVNTQSQVQEIVLEMLLLCEIPVTLVTWFCFLFRRSQMLSFFSDWAKLEEKQVIGYDVINIRRFVLFLYAVYSILGMSFMINLSIFFAFDPHFKRENDLIAYYYPSLKTSDNYDIVLYAGNILQSITFTLLFCTIDIVTIAVYYHAAKMMDAMKHQINQSITEDVGERQQQQLQEHVNFIWSRYETLRNLMDRADKLFGSMVLINQVILFLFNFGFVSLLMHVFKINKGKQRSGEEEHIFEALKLFMICVCTYSCRLLFCVSFMGKVQKASDQLFLAFSSASFLQQPVDTISSSENRNEDFVIRLHQAKMSSKPAAFYDIMPSVVLTLLSFIASFLIALLHYSEIFENDDPNYPHHIRRNVTRILN